MWAARDDPRGGALPHARPGCEAEGGDLVEYLAVDESLWAVTMAAGWIRLRRLGSLGREVIRLHAGSRRADLVLRLHPCAAIGEAAVVDLCVDVEFGEAGVDVVGPALPPRLEPLGVLSPLDPSFSVVIVGVR